MDEATEASIKWAAGFLKENPDAGFKELHKAKPTGMKVWKGLMGAVRAYMTTGKITAPARKERVVEHLRSTTTPGSIFERIENLEVKLLATQDAMEDLENTVQGLMARLGLSA